MPDELVRILFCDNEPPHHDDFVRHVIPMLKRALTGIRFQVEHSQSLEQLEADYSPKLRRGGARAVRSFLSRVDCAWEIVITDLDFASENEMGSHTTGFDIIETIYERSQQEFPWCEFLLFSAVVESMPPERYVATARILKGNPNSLIRLARSVAEKSWQHMADRAVILIKDALRIRALSQENGRQEPESTPLGSGDGKAIATQFSGGEYKPDIYEIVLLKCFHLDHKVCLIVRSKEHPGSCFRVASDGAEQYTLLALAASISGFVSSANLGALAAKQTGDPNRRAFGEDAVKQHIEKIRSWFGKEPVRLDGEPSGAVQFGKTHKGKHRTAEICGYCVVYTKLRGGYTLGGAARIIEIPKGNAFDQVFKDPEIAIKKYGTASSKSLSLR